VSRANVDSVVRSFEGWNDGDVDRWVEAAHPDIEWISEISRQVEGSATVYRGVDGLRRYWDEWHELWNATIDLTDTHDLGDVVIAVGSLRTQGMASGVGLERPIAFVFEFDADGRARRARAYFDVDEAFAEARGRAAGLP
jgi:ketosteroid isomerase-like protein